MNDLSLQLEALLFALGRPLSRGELQTMLRVDVASVTDAITALQKDLRGRGIVLVDDGSVVELRAAPDAAPLIERVRKEEYTREIGRAGLEVLTAILYRGPLTRSEIDFIRGVNSSQTLRTLLMRGLIRRVQNSKEGSTPEGRRSSFRYEPTTELFAALGVGNKEELPDYTAVREKLSALEASYRAREEEP